MERTERFLEPVLGPEAAARARRLARRAHQPELLALCATGRPTVAATSTRLMAMYRDSHDMDAFALLYELNQRDFLRAIRRILRQARLDADDILQDVFVSIHRYAHAFVDAQDSSFARWSCAIVRHTAVQHLRRDGRFPDLSTEVFSDSLADGDAEDPADHLLDAESNAELGLQWLILLLNYLRAFESRLNEREREALRLVEVLEMPYREASLRLNLSLGNLKMIVCRARRKIFSDMTVHAARLAA